MSGGDYPYTIRPIDHWPGERTKYPGWSRFKAGISQTTATLRRELSHLDATNVILQIDVTERMIRVDGGLYANAAPASGALILSFESNVGPLQYAVDTYADWRDNLRAIALSLEALRSVDRYGVTRRGEQYAGWKALPPPADHMTRDQARDLLVRNGGFRAAALLHHPDRGGDAVLFRRITAAKAVLVGAGEPVP